MYILVSSIIFAILYTAYACWVYITSEVLPVRRFVDNEISIENIQFNKYFKF